MGNEKQSKPSAVSGTLTAIQIYRDESTPDKQGQKQISDPIIANALSKGELELLQSVQAYATKWQDALRFYHDILEGQFDQQNPLLSEINKALNNQLSIEEKRKAISKITDEYRNELTNNPVLNWQLTIIVENNFFEIQMPESHISTFEPMVEVLTQIEKLGSLNETVSFLAKDDTRKMISELPDIIREFINSGMLCAQFAIMNPGIDVASGNIIHTLQDMKKAILNSKYRSDYASRLKARREAELVINSLPNEIRENPLIMSCYAILSQNYFKIAEQLAKLGLLLTRLQDDARNIDNSRIGTLKMSGAAAENLNKINKTRHENLANSSTRIKDGLVEMDPSKVFNSASDTIKNSLELIETATELTLTKIAAGLTASHEMKKSSVLSAKITLISSALKSLYTDIILGSNVTEELMGLLVEQIKKFDQEISAHQSKTVQRISDSRKQLN